MKIFISWSGERSRQMATIMKEWIENCFQNVEAFMSQHDIDPGSRWALRLNEELQNSDFGVLCLTPENLHADWILFEAGALSKKVEISRLVPILWQVEQASIAKPIAQFNNLSLDENGLLKLNQEINKALSKSLTPDKLKNSYDAFLPKAQKSIGEIATSIETAPVKKNQTELIEKVLEIVKNQFEFTTRLAKIRMTSDQILKSMNAKDLNNFIQECLKGAQETNIGVDSKYYLERIHFAANIMKENFPTLVKAGDDLIKSIDKISEKKGWGFGKPVDRGAIE